MHQGLELLRLQLSSAWLYKSECGYPFWYTPQSKCFRNHECFWYFSGKIGSCSSYRTWITRDWCCGKLFSSSDVAREKWGSWCIVKWIQLIKILILEGINVNCSLTKYKERIQVQYARCKEVLKGFLRLAKETFPRT